MTAKSAFGPLTKGVTAHSPKLLVASLLLASFVVGLDTRVFSSGLSDIRGPFALNVDEASWLSTIANAPQILISSAVAWLATVFGVRRIMIPSTLIYAGISLIIPFVHVSEFLFALHAFRGLLLGVFLPATIMVIFRNLDTRYWLVGIALYTLRVPLSQHLSVVLVGVYGDYLGWQWLYWQDVVIAPVISILLIIAAPREDVNVNLLERADWGGMLLLGSAMAMLYVALDQGNRLDWFQSGLVTSLLVAGLLLTVGFFINESLVKDPWAHASVILTRNIGLGYVIIIAFAFSSAGASIAVPGYIQNVVGLRPSALSGVYLSGAVLPILLLIIVATKMQRRVDSRLCAVIGFLAMAVGSNLGMQLTSGWSPWSFFAVILLQSGGQTLAFFATVVYLIANSDPKRSTAVSAYIQVIRLGGVELAVSSLNTWIRHREQFHSNSLGLAVSTSSRGLEIFQTELESVLGKGLHPAEVLSHAASAVRSQAYVLAYADSFEISFWFAVAALLLVSCLGPMPFGPLHPRFRHAASNP